MEYSYQLNRGSLEKLACGDIYGQYYLACLVSGANITFSFL